jgi:hypothetical protein
MGLITIQVLLGVEAWMGKFINGIQVESAKAPPIGQAFLRTAHAHVGAWVLAVGVVFAIVARRNPAAPVGPPAAPSVDFQQTPTPEPVLAGR